MSDYQTWRVWQKAHSLPLQVYHVKAAFPASELYGLSSRMWRAAASVFAQTPRKVQVGSHRPNSLVFAASRVAHSTSWSTTSFSPAISGTYPR